MNIVKKTRGVLKMSQPEFGRWLHGRIGGVLLGAQRISKYENGATGVPAAMRKECMIVLLEHYGIDECVEGWV